MAADKEIFELDDITLTILNSGANISFVAQVDGYPVDFQVPIEVMQEFLGGKPKAYGGSSNPTGALGTKDDFYFQTNGKIYQRGATAWALVVTMTTSDPAVAPETIKFSAGASLPGFIDMTSGVRPLFGLRPTVIREIDKVVDGVTDNTMLQPADDITYYKVHSSSAKTTLENILINGHDDGTGHFAEDTYITIKI